MDKIKFLLLFLWQLPQNLVALCMFPFLGKLRFISNKNHCLAFEGSKMMGGISLGSFAFVSPYSAKDEATVAHEQIGHSTQSHLLGPLYLVVIGLPSILHAALHKNCPCYYHFYTESWANKCANIKTIYRANGTCYTELIKEK